MSNYTVTAWCPGGCGWFLPDLQDRQGRTVWMGAIYLWMFSGSLLQTGSWLSLMGVRCYFCLRLPEEQKVVLEQPWASLYGASSSHCLWAAQVRVCRRWGTRGTGEMAPSWALGMHRSSHKPCIPWQSLP